MVDRYSVHVTCTHYKTKNILAPYTRRTAVDGRRMTVLYGDGSAVRRTVGLVQICLRYGTVAVQWQPSAVVYGTGAQP